MKKLIIFFLLTTTFLYAQNYKIIKDTRTHKPMLIGSAARTILNDSNFVSWYKTQYTKYKVDTNTIKNNETKLAGKRIKIVLGTWCSDSRREVPRMLKILDAIGFAKDSLQLIFVDRTKNGISNETKNLNIERVPTIIVYNHNKELGRIIETPEETLEKDLVKIVSQ